MFRKVVREDSIDKVAFIAAIYKIFRRTHTIGFERALSPEPPFWR
jgi:hypothetical protein